MNDSLQIMMWGDTLENIQKDHNAKLKRNWENAFQKWSNDMSQDATALNSYVPQWISVTERLPDDGTLLGKLICDSDGKIRIANQHAMVKLKNKTIHTDLIDLVKFMEQKIPAAKWVDCTHITHWMPLPEPPKEET